MVRSVATYDAECYENLGEISDKEAVCGVRGADCGFSGGCLRCGNDDKYFCRLSLVQRNDLRHKSPQQLRNVNLYEIGEH